MMEAFNGIELQSNEEDGVAATSYVKGFDFAIDIYVPDFSFISFH
jgi:hypothetical protein